MPTPSPADNVKELVETMSQKIRTWSIISSTNSRFARRSGRKPKKSQAAAFRHGGKILYGAVPLPTTTTTNGDPNATARRGGSLPIIAAKLQQGLAANRMNNKKQSDIAAHISGNSKKKLAADRGPSGPNWILQQQQLQQSVYNTDRYE
jgi:hypothetical protein